MHGSGQAVRLCLVVTYLRFKRLNEILTNYSHGIDYRKVFNSKYIWYSMYLASQRLIAFFLSIRGNFVLSIPTYLK